MSPTEQLSLELPSEESLEKLGMTYPRLGLKVRSALTAIEEAISRHGCVPSFIIDFIFEHYRLSTIALSFNGGKDCLVLLVLYLIATRNEEKTLLDAIYVTGREPFAELQAFVKLVNASCSKLHLCKYDESDLKKAFALYLNDHPHIEAIMVGVRRTDPFAGSLTTFAETDHGWPSFMRVHPILDWTYEDIWTFIQVLNMPYCKLYDQGYTSLGSRETTKPNPNLLDEKHLKYQPAYMLKDKDGTLERAGRAE